MTSRDIEKTGMSFHGAYLYLSLHIAGWPLWDLRDPPLEACRRVVTR